MIYEALLALTVLFIPAYLHDCCFVRRARVILGIC